MLRRLKAILNSLSDKELDEIDVWVNGDEEIDRFFIEEKHIDLITETASVKINGNCDMGDLYAGGSDE